MMNVARLLPSDPRWQEFLARAPHDYYHLPRYVALEAEREGGAPIAYLVEREDTSLFVPLIAREFALKTTRGGLALRDATSPYGYACPLAHGPHVHSAMWNREAYQALHAAMKNDGLTAAFLRLHPLLSGPAGELSELGELATAVYHGDTVWIDLRDSHEELWQQTRPTHRNMIQQLRKKGYTARIESDLRSLPVFAEIYQQTMCRVGASSFYYFSYGYLEGLRDALPGVMHLCMVERDGAATCAGLFSECAGIMQFHLAGTRDEYLRDSPTRLMLHEMRAFAKQRGNTRFHLGGGLGGATDALYQFKAGFSKRTAPMHTLRLIVDEHRYHEATMLWSETAKCAPEPITGFFPAYRKPLESMGSNADKA